MGVYLRNEPCDCPEGVCAAFVEPPSECINRLTGEVMTHHCVVCNPGRPEAASWHQDGRCLRCAWLLAHGAPADQDDGQQGGGPGQGED